MYSEKTLRNKAEKIGYHIEKGFVHSMYGQCPVWHNVAGERETGYNILDYRTNTYVWGCYNWYYDHQFSLEDVQEFLADEYEKAGLKF